MPYSSNPGPRYALLTEGTILLLAITTLAIAGAYGKQLLNAPIDHERLKYYDYGKSSRSVAWVVFYCGTMPIIAILCSLVGLALYGRARFHPVYPISISTILLAGSVVNIAFWVSCDTGPNDYFDYYCYQHALQLNGSPIPVGISLALTATKILFAALLMGGYFVYMLFAAVAVHKWRKNSRSKVSGKDVVGEKVDGDYM